jgi:hypothetical protein
VRSSFSQIFLRFSTERSRFKTQTFFNFFKKNLSLNRCRPLKISSFQIPHAATERNDFEALKSFCKFTIFRIKIGKAKWKARLANSAFFWFEIASALRRSASSSSSTPNKYLNHQTSAFCMRAQLFLSILSILCFFFFS